MVSAMNKPLTPLFLLLLTLFGCGGGSTHTETITNTVEVPPPPPEANDIALTLSASWVDGGVTNNGEAFPPSSYDDGRIVFEGSDSDDRFVAANTTLPDYDILVLNGTYRMIYQVDTPGQQVPLNTHSVLMAEHHVSESHTVDLDVSSILITPVFTLNGSSFPASQYDHALFYLQPVAGGERIFLGDSSMTNTGVRVTPGSYHVVYEYQQGTVSPINKGARVLSDVSLVEDQRLGVDVSAGDVRATFTLAGNAFPSSQYDHAEFFLKDLTSLSESFLMKSYDGTVSLPVIDGTYDVLYKLVQSTTIPLNRNKVIASNVTFTGGGAVNQNIEQVSFDLVATLNGSAFPASEYQDGIIELYDSATDSYTELGNTHGSLAGITLISGAYEVIYSHETGDAVPQNVRGTVVEQHVFNSSDTVNVDVVAVLVTANVSLNDADFSLPVYQSGDILLAGTQSVSDIFVGNTSNLATPVMVLAGSYDLFYRHKSGDDVPQNTRFQLLSSQSVVENTELEANIDSLYIRVSALLNDLEFPASQTQFGEIYASSGTGDRVKVLETHAEGAAIMMAEGDYGFFYQHVSGESVPANTWALIAEQTLVNMVPQ